jgi:diaminopimelate epimerase
VLTFRKVEGLGNDFVLLDRLDLDADTLAREVEWAQAAAPKLCDRRTGIGADGILLVGPGRAGAASMIVINFDGSRPEMCGNGLRCVAAFVAEQLDVQSLSIDTDAGPRACRILGVDAGVFSVSVDMGPAERLGVRRPTAGNGREFVGISMGNPHAVCFLEAKTSQDPETLARTLGPAIERDPVFAPGKTNVEFARIEADSSITLWVWERGVGITSACGTGACATAAAAVDLGLLAADHPIAVRLPGGRLSITVPRVASEQIVMEGPARQVFSGMLDSAAASSAASSTSSSSGS